MCYGEVAFKLYCFHGSGIFVQHLETILVGNMLMLKVLLCWRFLIFYFGRTWPFQMLLCGLCSIVRSSVMLLLYTETPSGLLIHSKLTH